MNIEQFVEKVKLMRQYQVAYFKNRKRDDLIASKLLEKEVDQALAEGILPGAVTRNLFAKREQLSLFEDGKS